MNAASPTTDGSDAHSGKPASPGDAKAILEAFKSGDRMPGDEEEVLEGSGGGDAGFSFAPYSIKTNRRPSLPLWPIRRLTLWPMALFAE